MNCNNCGVELKEGEVYFCTLCSMEEMYDPYTEYVDDEVKGMREREE